MRCIDDANLNQQKIHNNTWSTDVLLLAIYRGIDSE